jgi:hypothetical protein
MPKKPTSPQDYIPFFGTYGRNCLFYKGPAPKTPKEALNISIAKWTVLSKDPTIFSDGGPLTCGFCLYYKMSNSKDITIPTCRKCPIYKKTKRINCLETPYRVYCEKTLQEDSKGMIKAAKQELRFLKSFLRKPKGSKP